MGKRVEKRETKWRERFTGGKAFSDDLIYMQLANSVLKRIKVFLYPTSFFTHQFWQKVADFELQHQLS